MTGLRIARDPYEYLSDPDRYVTRREREVRARNPDLLEALRMHELDVKQRAAVFSALEDIQMPRGSVPHGIDFTDVSDEFRHIPERLMWKILGKFAFLNGERRQRDAARDRVKLVLYVLRMAA